MKKYIFLYFLLLFCSVNCYAINQPFDIECFVAGLQKEFTAQEITDMGDYMSKNNVLYEKKYKDRLDAIVKKCLK